MSAKWIGVDGATWANGRGYGRFTRELMRALVKVDRQNQYCLFLDSATDRADVPVGLPVVNVPVKQAPTRAASADGYRSPRDMWAFSHAMVREAVDLIFFPSVYTFVPIPQTARGKPLVVGIHDVIPERFPSQVFKSARARLFWTVKTRLAIWQAARILTVSEYAKLGIQAHLHVPANRIRVTHEAAAPVFQPVSDAGAISAALARAGIAPGGRYVIYFGGLTPHKNIGMLIDVFADLIQCSHYSDLKLILAGDYTRDVYYSAFTSLRARVEARCPGAVVFAGYVDDGDAACLLSGALACVLPSLEEGFGLPGIEAAACGTPLIATRNSAMPQWLGDSALYIDPTRPADLRAALERVLQDAGLSRYMREQALSRSRNLTWESAAESVMRVFDEL